jgi:dTDP-4-dehydrorhamnose reductase
MRLLVTGAGGLIGSNFVAAAAQQSWSVLGAWHQTPVSVPGARTAALDVADRHACVALAEQLEPDVVVHAAASGAPGRLEREPRLAELNLVGTENTLAAARAVRARYVLVSCDDIFSGRLPSGECWEEHDRAEPLNAHGRSMLACERLAQDSRGSWLITRPADVYGVNLSIPAADQGRSTAPADSWSAPSGPSEGRSGATPGGAVPEIPGAARGGGGDRCGGNGGGGSGSGGGSSSGSGSGGSGSGGEPSVADERAQEELRARAQHVWGRSGAPLLLVAALRAGQALPAPAGVRRSPTYAWDYAQRVCDLIAQECEGVYNTAGPTILGRLAHLRLLARAFGCPLELVREGSLAAYLRACGEPAEMPVPANTALCDRKASFILGRPAVDPFAGHRLMRRQLEQVLGSTQAPPAPLREPAAPVPPISVEALG